jgi:predicted Zn-dependent peptidase
MKKIILDNGLRVVMEEIPTCRSVAFGIWVKTGSRNETPEDNGISHFIEHMLFKGTDRYTAKDIADIFDGIGGNVNAFTSKEYTCYYAKVLDDHLPQAVEVLSNMFFNSILDPSDMSKEKNVILEEISMYEDTPDDLVHDLVSKAAYADHPLAYSILGLEKRLKAMDPDSLRQYMARHYIIENTVISLAGNINEDVLELIRKHFDGFNNHGELQTVTAPTFRDGLIFHKKKAEQNHICLSLPGYQVNHEHTYAMVLLNNMIGGGMSSRLFQEIREKRGLAYSVYSYHSSYMDSGLFTIYAGTAPGQTEEVLQVTMDVLNEIQVNGMTEAELRRGKEQLKGSLILSLESTSSRMNRLGKNELLIAKHYNLDELIARIEKVSLDQVQTVIKHTFAQPFAMSMVGSNDKTIAGFRRDQLV